MNQSNDTARRRPHWLGLLRSPETRGWQVGVMTVTPDLAREMLAANSPHNRGLREELANKYQRDIEGNNWIENGEPLIFDREGFIVSGQHRLQACIQANRAFPSLIVFGVDPQARVSVDTGTPHSVSDYFKMELGVANYNVITAACALIFRHDKAVGGLTNRHTRISLQELAQTFKDNEVPLVESVKRVLTGPRLVPQSVETALRVLFTRVNADKASEFFARLEDGAGLEPGHPILALRAALIRSKEGRRAATRGNNAVVFHMAYTIKAWNAFIEDRSVERITFAPSKEDFPVISNPVKVATA